MKNLNTDYDFFQLPQQQYSNDFTVYESSTLTEIAEKAFDRLSFTFTKEHLDKIIKAALCPQSSDNDRYVCSCILKNALVASEGTYPICQDTGIANIFGWTKGNFFLTGDAYESISEGVKQTYDKRKLRFSTTCPVSFYEEKDPKNNMPCQISIFNNDSCLAPLPDFIDDTPQQSLNFLLCAKGGGSSNKTSFIQGTKATLNKNTFSALIKEQLSKLGTSACPPYTIAIVAGGLSPEQNLLTLKLATCGAYDNMTDKPNPKGFRDKELEALALHIAQETGYGSQFGGSAFALDVIVIRLPRHGASCPVSFGVSCSAHRNLKVTVTKDGYYLQKTVHNPSLLKDFDKAIAIADKNNGSTCAKRINTDNGIKNVLQQLKGSNCGDRILLSGKILVARDAAHARWQALIDQGKDIPQYCKLYPICYAGPARTPEGKIIGSFGPTTAGRMDTYAQPLMSRGASLVTLAKGNRSKYWSDSCKEYKAFYLGTPGGIAALIAKQYITDQQIIDYEDLGMEAVRLVTVKDLPCFVITNDKGEDFYDRLKNK